MNNKLILHTGSDRLETEYAEYIRDRVGAGMCTGLGELGDLSEVEEIICIFRYEYKNAALPEAVVSASASARTVLPRPSRSLRACAASGLPTVF